MNRIGEILGKQQVRIRKYITPKRVIILFLIVSPLAIFGIYHGLQHEEQSHEEYLSFRRQYQLIHEIDSLNGIVTIVSHKPIKYGLDFYLTLNNGAKLTIATHHYVYKKTLNRFGSYTTYLGGFVQENDSIVINKSDTLYLYRPLDVVSSSNDKEYEEFIFFIAGKQTK